MRTPTLVSSALALVGAGLISFAGPVSAQTISLSSCTGGWSINSNSNSFTCNQGGAVPNPSAPSGCGITASTTSVPSTGGTVTLAASCSTVAATSWSWSGGFMANSTASGGSGTVTAPTTFTATPSANGVTGNPVSVTVNVQSGSTSGGTANGPAVCSGFANTRYIALSWNSVVAGGVVRAYTSTQGGFGASDAVVVTFTTPASKSSDVGNFFSAESGGSAINRLATISTSACDFEGLAKVESTSPVLAFSVGAPNPYTIQLDSGRQYFINIKNLDCAPGSVCDMNVGLKKPRGL